MIQANELRVENWVYDSIKKKNAQITQIWANVEFVELEPIPLTPEMLLKARFSNGITYYKEIIQGKRANALAVAWNDGDNWYCYFQNRSDGELVLLRDDLKHLHQLQNLYFALTGEELDIKL